MKDLRMPILTDADYAKINKELERQEAIRAQVQMAKEAGFPCDEQDQACQEMIARLTQVKKVYFEDRP